MFYHNIYVSLLHCIYICCCLCTVLLLVELFLPFCTSIQKSILMRLKGLQNPSRQLPLNKSVLPETLEDLEQPQGRKNNINDSKPYHTAIALPLDSSSQAFLWRGNSTYIHEDDCDIWMIKVNIKSRSSDSTQGSQLNS